MAFSLSSICFLTNTWHFLPEIPAFSRIHDLLPPTSDIFSQKYVIWAQRSSLPEKALFWEIPDIFSPKYYLTLLQWTFSPVFTIFSPRDHLAHQKYRSCSPLQDSLSHRFPLFSLIYLICSLKFQLSPPSMTFSPRNSRFSPRGWHLLPKRTP